MRSDYAALSEVGVAGTGADALRRAGRHEVIEVTCVLLCAGITCVGLDLYGLPLVYGELQ